MKINILAVMFALGSVAQGATYTVGNSSLGFDANGVTDNAGNLLSGSQGSAAFGFFDSDADVTTATSAADLLDASWHIFGDSESNFNASTPPVNSQGLFQSQGSEVADLSDFSDQSIYLVIGKGATLAASTEFLVYKFNETFGSASEEPINSTLTFDADTITIANLLVGGIGGDRAVSPLDPTPQASFFTAELVPEPSSTALLGLGGLALILRRRR
ncbi:hypothetical protein NT6N_11720 [Oceaniferula spumae]|uniref:Ice-binding protein C-terminal domain-containing protein n=1 Tax=Oceaniferula spumae TaxID=2979115 RepID=A0AAT9FJL2_9BACT